MRYTLTHSYVTTHKLVLVLQVIFSFNTQIQTSTHTQLQPPMKSVIDIQVVYTYLHTYHTDAHKHSQLKTTQKIYIYVSVVLFLRIYLDIEMTIQTHTRFFCVQLLAYTHIYKQIYVTNANYLTYWVLGNIVSNSLYLLTLTHTTHTTSVCTHA